MTASPESDAWLAEGGEEVERHLKKARAATGGDEGLEADQGLAQHFKVNIFVLPYFVDGIQAQGTRTDTACSRSWLYAGWCYISLHSIDRI